MPDKIIPEPYFYRWKTIIVIDPNKKINDVPVGTPMYQHLTCGGTILIPEDRIPLKVCPNCGKNCETEAKMQENLEKQGGRLLDAPEQPLDIKKIFEQRGIIPPNDV